MPARVLPAPTKISSPARARARTRTHTRLTGAPCPPSLTLPPSHPANEVSRSPERRGDHHRSSVLVALPVAMLAVSSSSHRGEPIRPRLTHRYSRGLLGARGKMRQVVVRSRSPGERYARSLSPLRSPSPRVRPSVRPFVRPSAWQRHSFVRVYHARAGARVSDRAHVYACAAGASPSRQVHIFARRPRDRGPINGWPP